MSIASRARAQAGLKIDLGIDRFANLPAFARELPESLASHTRAHRDFGRFKGMRIAVVHVAVLSRHDVVSELRLDRVAWIQNGREQLLLGFVVDSRQVRPDAIAFALHRVTLHARLREDFRAVFAVAGHPQRRLETLHHLLAVARHRALEKFHGALLQVVDGPEEWLGTTISFDLRQEGDWTIILFKHEGWKTPVEFMNHCSTKWGVFLISLKSLLETGQGRPWPNEIKLDSWE